MLIIGNHHHKYGRHDEHALSRVAPNTPNTFEIWKIQMQHGQFIPRVTVIYTCNVTERCCLRFRLFQRKNIAFCTSETNFEVYNKIS